MEFVDNFPISYIAWLFLFLCTNLAGNVTRKGKYWIFEIYWVEEGEMRVFVFAAILSLFSGLAFADAGTPNLKNLDKPIELNAGEVKSMYVVFNHSTHKSVACRVCHHEGLPKNRYAPCTSPGCHTITAPSSREPLSVFMAYHALDMKRSCLGCHKSLRKEYPQFVGCKPCHQSVGGKKQEEPGPVNTLAAQ